MGKHIDHYRGLLEEVVDLIAAEAILSWDQQVFMPPSGTPARAAQLATLKSLAHSKFTGNEMLDALGAARTELVDLDPDSLEARLVTEIGRDIEKQMKVPKEWVAKFTRITSLAQETWQKAKAEDDFAAFAPKLDEIFGLRRDYSDFFEPYDHVYDPLLDDFEPGMKSSQLDALFDTLRKEQVELVATIADAGPIDDSVLHQKFPIKGQWAFGETVIKTFGFDFERGRQDKSPHPFTTSFSIDDVRITTRFQEEFLSPALFATLHEAGHAMYEQGIAPELARTPLAEGTSLGIHESQSRLWENLVGRSRPFWVHFYPRLRETFPEQLGEVDLEVFHRAVNRVEPSLIRVEADEATYNLHIMLRFELEKALLAGDLHVADLPTAWNDRFDEYLGIAPPNDSKGVLQDIHWSSGYIGYFPTYSLGNLVACQWWQVLRRELPDLDNQLERGEFEALLSWLQHNIYQHGKKFKPVELIQRITGDELSAQPYIEYLKSKFGEIYNLS
jgi:carboxypeptidase Taq